MATMLWLVAEKGRPTGTKVTDVEDGDTIDGLLGMDCGFGDQLVRRKRFRMARINAAKGPTGSGTAATAELRRLLFDPANPVKSLTSLKPYKYGGPNKDYPKMDGGPKGYGGEYMAEIELDDGTNVSDAMVAAGHAVYWDGTGPRPGDG
jgi:endonuclease YncB( thermonuclease family)